MPLSSLTTCLPPNLQIFTRGESIASLQQDLDSLRKDIGLVASGEEKTDCDEQHVENMDGCFIHETAMVKNNTATNVEKSIGEKRVIPHKNRSGKRVSR